MMDRSLSTLLQTFIDLKPLTATSHVSRLVQTSAITGFQSSPVAGILRKSDICVVIHEDRLVRLWRYVSPCLPQHLLPFILPSESPARDPLSCRDVQGRTSAFTSRFWVDLLLHLKILSSHVWPYLSTGFVKSLLRNHVSAYWIFISILLSTFRSPCKSYTLYNFDLGLYGDVLIFGDFFQLTESITRFSCSRFYLISAFSIRGDGVAKIFESV